MLHKKIMLPVLGVALLGSTLFGAQYVSAQDATPGAGLYLASPSIVQRIAQKFKLSEADVQKVFDEEHSARRSEMQKKSDENLNQAVKDGKITTAQKDAIVKKFSEMKEIHKDPEAFKEMTPEERQKAMQGKKTELENWAKENGLTLEVLHEVMGKNGGFMTHKDGSGFKMRMMKFN